MKNTDRFRQAVPDWEGSKTVPGLESDVEIRRDAVGVPHITARQVSDAFFAQGYVQAQDRLWQMDRDRRRAYGEWAAAVGVIGVEQDLLWRRFRLRETSQQILTRLKPDTVTMLESFVHGVNSYILTQETLPAEFALVGYTPALWQPYDPIALFLARHTFMGRFEAKIWRGQWIARRGPDVLGALVKLSPQALTFLRDHRFDMAGLKTFAQLPMEGPYSMPDPDEGGSNNWVISGTRTQTGRPILAGDPHRPLELPNGFYQNHLMCDAFDVIGLSFPGVPGFSHFGHNDRVAWSVTHAGADTQDVYVEELRNSARGLQFRTVDGWALADVKRETIAVRGHQSVPLETVQTRHGPVVSMDATHTTALAVKWTAWQGSNYTFDAIRDMLEAGSLTQLTRTMERWVDPVNNLLMADTDGHISLLVRGQLPVRHPDNAWVPVSGWLPEYEWGVAAPFADMPRLVDPPLGVIATANNQVTRDDFPYYITLDFSPPHRVHRIEKMLVERTDWQPGDMRRIHADLFSSEAVTFLRALPSSISGCASSQEALDLLAGWDGIMAADSVAASIYNVTRTHLLVSLLREILGPELFNPLGLSPAVPSQQFQRLHWWMGEFLADPSAPIWRRAGVDPRHALDQALCQSIDLLTTMHQDRRAWRWGRLHQLCLHHPLESLVTDSLPSVEQEMGGDADTVQATMYRVGQGYGVTASAIARYVFDVGDWDNSEWIVPTGSSGHPGSDHFLDQNAKWLNHRMVPMPYTMERVREATRYYEKLIPDALPK